MIGSYRYDDLMREPRLPTPNPTEALQIPCPGCGRVNSEKQPGAWESLEIISCVGCGASITLEVNWTNGLDRHVAIVSCERRRS